MMIFGKGNITHRPIVQYPILKDANIEAKDSEAQRTPLRLQVILAIFKLFNIL